MSKKTISIIAIISGLIIFSSVFGINIFKENIIYWLFLIGVLLVITGVLSLPFTSITDAVSSSNTGITLIGIAFVSGLIYMHFHNGYPPPGYPPLTNLEMSKKCESAEWVIAINYYDKYNVSHYDEFKFIGTKDQSENQLPKIIDEWNQKHTNLTMIGSDKVLTFIPEEYSKIHAYEKDHSNCPIGK